MSRKISIDSNGIMAFVWSSVDFLITIIKGILIIGGAIGASLADVVFGALTLSLLLVNIEGTAPEVRYAPILVSMGASGIQLILWQLIQNKGGIARLWKSRDFALIVSLFAVILMKFGDDYMDIAIINYLMVGSVLPASLGPTMFSFLKAAVLFIVWVLTGFSEIFVVNAVEILKGFKQDTSSQKNQQSHNSSHNNPGKQYRPNNPLSQETFDRLRNRNK